MGQTRSRGGSGIAMLIMKWRFHPMLEKKGARFVGEEAMRLGRGPMVFFLVTHVFFVNYSDAGEERQILASDV